MGKWVTAYTSDVEDMNENNLKSHFEKVGLQRTLEELVSWLEDSKEDYVKDVKERISKALEVYSERHNVEIITLPNWKTAEMRVILNIIYQRIIPKFNDEFGETLNRLCDLYEKDKDSMGASLRNALEREIRANYKYITNSYTAYLHSNGDVELVANG